MPNTRLAIEPHLTHKQIEKQYKSCKNHVEKEHWHMLWLMTRPEYPCSTEEAGMLVGRTSQSVRNTLYKYNRKGPDGLKDNRKGRSGRKPLLTKRQQKQLFKVLQKDPSDGGMWTGPKVSRWVEEKIKVHVSNVTGWQYLRVLGFTLQVPRPSHSESATIAEQTVWKKN